jgi:deoxyribonuclease-4
MIRFGPAGQSDSFKEQGYKHTNQMPAWLEGMGLTAMEYSGGHGVQMGEETARKIGEEAEKHGVAVSIHAPYYINLAEPDEAKLANTFRYMEDAAKAVRAMGGRRVIFHAASFKGKEHVFSVVQRGFERALELLAPYDVILCPETMGRLAQFGRPEEITALCALAPNTLPCIDFAHLHALERLVTPDDFKHILDPMIDKLGMERMRHFHAHFSHIEYTDKGEKRHRNFDEEGFGPEFLPLAEVLFAYKLEPVIICESRGHQAEDALAMLRQYQEVANAQ